MLGKLDGLEGIETAATPPVNVWLLTDERYIRQRMPHALAEWLASEGLPGGVILAEDEARVDIGSDPASLCTPWDGFEPGDVVVTRSRSEYALALQQVAEALGGRAVDPWSSVLDVRDKLRCAIALARQRIPAPPTFLARRPADLRWVPPEIYPLILKPVLGDNARGVRVVMDSAALTDGMWGDGLVLAQRYMEVGGVDLKVYVADESVWAVRRPSPLTDAIDAPVRARVTTTISDLVSACRAAFGLRLFGLDVLEPPEGPVVVDVNEFPNYTGVDEAPEVIGRALAATATARVLHHERLVHA